MMASLEEKLQKFLDDHEEAKKAGVTLETVYQATLNCADHLLQLEQREIAWREDLRRDALSAATRMRNLEADLESLKRRVVALEQDLKV